MIKFYVQVNQILHVVTTRKHQNVQNEFLIHSQDEALTNITKSVLNFVPTTEDDGKSITCRAENPKVSGLFLETTWKIEVICELNSVEMRIKMHIIIPRGGGGEGGGLKGS